MSELEDRHDAAPAVEAPAAETPAAAPENIADLEAVAAVEGATDDDEAKDSPAVLSEADDPAEGDLEAVEADAGEAPLLDGELEEGIASVFAALQAAAQTGEIGESDEPAGPLGDAEAVDGITFRLLGELDRLWHRAA